jgi:putative transposase
MKRSRFSDEQIIGILKEQEAGSAAADVWRRHGISGAAFYKWKAKFGGLEVTEAKRLRTLEEDNAKLKKRLAEGMLAIAVLRDTSTKNGDARRGAERGRPAAYSRQGRGARLHGPVGRAMPSRRRHAGVSYPDRRAFSP